MLFYRFATIVRRIETSPPIRNLGTGRPNGKVESDTLAATVGRKTRKLWPTLKFLCEHPCMNMYSLNVKINAF